MTSKRTRPPAGRDNAAVVVPIYRAERTADEEISLRHLREFLGGYDLYLATPENLELDLEGFRRRPFPARYFSGTDAYSALLLSPTFYRAFLQYEYLLIYQLDSLVFEDALRGWCDADFDYVGAPWLDVPWVERLSGVPDAVGNGGFSLRRVEAFLRVLESKRYWMEPDEYWQTYWAGRPPHVRLANLPRKYLKRLHRFNGVTWETRRWLSGTNTSREFGTAEDVFWSFLARHYDPSFTVAPVEAALRFAFETQPRRCLELTRGRLPFGCHAWARYDRVFWEPYLLEPAFGSASRNV